MLMRLNHHPSYQDVPGSQPRVCKERGEYSSTRLGAICHRESTVVVTVDWSRWWRMGGRVDAGPRSVAPTVKVVAHPFTGTKSHLSMNLVCFISQFRRKKDV